MNDAKTREHLLWLLRGGYAHIDLHGALADLPVSLRGVRPMHVAHTPWRLLEHVRIAQWDILEFSRDATHRSPEFPVGYWPEGDSPPSDTAWDECVAAIERDARAFEGLIEDPERDLLEPFPWGDGQTLLREALLLADHNAYHIGQLIVVRRSLGA